MNTRPFFEVVPKSVKLWGRIVVIVTAILTAYIGVLDFVLSKAVSVVLK